MEALNIIMHVINIVFNATVIIYILRRWKG